MWARGRAAVAKALFFGRQFRRLTYPSARKRIASDFASDVVRTDFPPVLYNMCAPHALGLVLSLAKMRPAPMPLELATTSSIHANPRKK
jgi:hypothetical protein